MLADGTLLCPSSTEHNGWRIHMEMTRDLGVTWTKTGPLNDGKEFGPFNRRSFFIPAIVCRRCVGPAGAHHGMLSEDEA